jgi:predicted dehydrogenase
MTYSPVRVGLIGCGNISDTYLSNAAMFADSFVIDAVSDIDPNAAKAAGIRHRLPAVSPEELIATPSIEAVLNLTVPSAHVPVALAVVQAGKHVYLEKPLGASVQEAKELLARAKERGVLVGAAPDTFLGAAHQTALKLIREGAIGDIVGGSAAIMDRGMEDWHPNPGFFFAKGGGPVFDMGPYYLTSLVSLLGPIHDVIARSSTGLKKRMVGRGPNAGAAIAIEVPTTINSVLRFANEVDVAFTASWDVWSHRRSHIEIYGTEGTLLLPDPNWFGGGVEISVRGGAFEPIFDERIPYGRENRKLGDGSLVADYRGLGLSDMAAAIRTGGTFHAGGKLALHVLSAIEAIVSSDVPLAHARSVPDLPEFSQKMSAGEVVTSYPLS